MIENLNCQPVGTIRRPKEAASGAKPNTRSVGTQEQFLKLHVASDL
jgi:hypothetical protein